MRWPDQVSAQGLPAAFAFHLALPLSQAGGQASKVRGSCLSSGAPILHHHICQLRQELPCLTGQGLPGR